MDVKFIVAEVKNVKERCLDCAEVLSWCGTINKHDVEMKIMTTPLR